MYIELNIRALTHSCKKKNHYYNNQNLVPLLLFHEQFDKVDVVYNLDKQNHKNNIGLQYLNKLLQKTNQKVVKKS